MPDDDLATISKEDLWAALMQWHREIFIPDFKRILDDSFGRLGDGFHLLVLRLELRSLQSRSAFLERRIADLGTELDRPLQQPPAG